MVSNVENIASAPLYFSTDSLASDVQGAQLGLADQVAVAVDNKARTMSDRAASVRSRALTATQLRLRHNGGTPSDAASLGRNSVEGRNLLSEVNQGGVIANAPTSYLWLTKTETTDSNGQQHVAWEASWHDRTLSAAVADGSYKLPPGQSVDTQADFSAGDWQGALASDRDVGVMVSDGNAAPTSCSDVSLEGGKTVYCFESDARIVVTNAQIDQWARALDTAVARDSEGLDLQNNELSSMLDSYGKVLDQAGDTAVQAQRLSDDGADSERQETIESDRQRDFMRSDNSRYRDLAQGADTADQRPEA